MASSTFINHCGGRDVAFDELLVIKVPPSTKTWYPVPHADVFRDTTAWCLGNAFTTVLGRTKQARPAEAALTTIKLQRLFTPEVIDGQVIQASETQFTAAV